MGSLNSKLRTTSLLAVSSFVESEAHLLSRKTNLNNQVEYKRASERAKNNRALECARKESNTLLKTVEEFIERASERTRSASEGLHPRITVRPHSTAWPMPLVS